MNCNDLLGIYVRRRGAMLQYWQSDANLQGESKVIVSQTELGDHRESRPHSCVACVRKKCILTYQNLELLAKRITKVENNVPDSLPRIITCLRHDAQA